MRHRLTIAALIALGLGASSVLAVERATFILTNGERISGNVVFHTEGRTNIRADKNLFTIGLNDGNETEVPYAQVAVIDFVGGQPRQEEFNALSEDQHLMTLRNGQNRYGHLVDLINGDTVRWQDSSSGRMDVPINQVRRVFLNTERTRDIFNVTKPAAAPAPAAPQASNNAPSSTVGSVVMVRGNTPWTDTGIDVTSGQTMRVEQSGRVFFSRATDNVADPSGNPQFRNDQFPVPSQPAGTLIAKVGSNGAPFAIGTNPSFDAPASGRLYLGVNDTIFDDNSGSFRVTVSRLGRGLANRGWTPSTPDSSTPMATGANQNVIVVRGNTAWTDTGLTLRAGESFRVAPTGRVSFARAGDTVAEPDGNASYRNEQFPVPDMPAGALIGKIGVNGRPFAVGSAPEPFQLRQAGRLYLGVNDTIFDDNSGSFRVTVTRAR
jgi:hypothetical protein